jgi:hypothetical protein
MGVIMYLSLFGQDRLRSTREGTYRSSAMNPCLIMALGLVAIILSPQAGVAATIHVPGDAPTIQAGIDMAESGSIASRGLVKRR